MTGKNDGSSLHVPSTLEAQLREYRAKVWTLKMGEAVGAAIAGFFGVYLAVFALDRLGDTPWWGRTAAIVLAVAICGVVPWFLHRWVWRRRRLEELARLLSVKLPRVGDRLLGVIELAGSRSEQARSRALCEAAIRQVAEDARQRDFLVAVPDSNAHAWSLAALAAVGAAGALLCFVPAAASNAWARLTAPWSDTPRYTFAAVKPLPSELVVPHGEPFALTASLDPATAWRPAEARLELGAQSALAAIIAKDRYAFDAPAVIEATAAKVTVGDWRQSLLVTPKLRPELTSIEARVALPAYLCRPEPVTRDVRGGSAAFVAGSRVTVVATANRTLAGAVIDDAPLTPAGATFATPPFDLTAARRVKLAWTDEFGLAAKQPFALEIAADEDAAPAIVCEDLPRRRVVLDTEQLTFHLAARDDFGVREAGMQWSSLSPQQVEHPAEGERVLGAGGPHKEQLELEGAFTAKALGIEPQAIEVRLYATDYLPDRQRALSPPYILFVLDAEQHAIWMTEQLSRWHRQALEVRDRELRLYETNKELQGLDPADWDRPDVRRKVENQAAAERANGRRLAALTNVGEDLLRQAARNPEIGVGHLDRWAEMLEILNDISDRRMPSVAELLLKASQGKAATSRTPAASAKMAGQAKAAGGPGRPTESPKGAKTPPTAPMVVDMESSQQPPAPSDGAGKTQKKNPTAPSLRLPQTTLVGQGKKPTGASPPLAPLDEAVREQKDLLAEFEKVADELNEVLANLEGSTLVKRLKAAARKQYRIAGDLGEKIEGWFGEDPGHDDGSSTAVAEIAKQEETSSVDVSYIMDDMQAYFERRRLVRFKTILDEMRKEDVIGSLRQVADDIQREQGTSIAQCEFWSDAMDRWAEDLVDPACSGACPGCRSKGSLPPSIVLEVLKILEGEINLREETRVAEQSRTAVEATVHNQEGRRLSIAQDTLVERVAAVIDRVRELPDSQTEFPKEIALLTEVGRAMDDASEILLSADTGPPAIAAETEAIELLLKSKRINPNGGGGGGANPGGGGGGDTKDSALALLGRGLNQHEVREERAPEQAVGDAGAALPAEYRAGLDRYFNELERSPSGG